MLANIIWVKIKKYVNSVRVQLVFYIVIITFVVLTVGAYFIYRNVVTILKENNEKYLMQQLIQAEYNIQNVFNELDRLSKTILLDDNILLITANNPNVSELELIERNKDVIDDFSNAIHNSALISSIYFFMEDGSGIGANEKYTTLLRGNNEDDKPFPDEIFEKSIELYPQKVLFGAVTEEYFTDIKSDDNIICQSRIIKPYGDKSMDSMLVLSIKEEYISSIYSKAESLNEGKVYIVNSDGVIVSSNESIMIGKEYNMFTFIDFLQDYGNFTTEKDDVPIQGYYYRLMDTDWYIVTEINVELYLVDIISMKRLLFIIFLLFILSIIFVSTIWINKIYRPLNTLSDKMYDLGKGNLGATFVDIPSNEFGTVMSKFNEMSVSINQLMTINDKIHREKRELEIESLQAQINPHFLYNTLNMIKWMAIGINANDIVNGIVTLGNMLKPVFNNITSMWSIGDELVYVSNYIKIINWRFENNIHIICNIDEKYNNYKIPRFVIQPIIENALTHGMVHSQKQMTINLSIIEKYPGIHIVVFNTGENIETQRLDIINKSLLNLQKDTHIGGKESIGLANVNKRIKLSLGEECLIKMENIPNGGVKTIIMINKEL